MHEGCSIKGKFHDFSTWALFLDLFGSEILLRTSYYVGYSRMALSLKCPLQHLTAGQSTTDTQWADGQRPGEEKAKTPTVSFSTVS